MDVTKKFENLLSIVPMNTLFGLEDTIPGISGSRIPHNAEAPLANSSVVKFKTIYVHNLRISSMNEIERSFNEFLAVWSEDMGQQLAEKPQISERRMSCVAHNTWRAIGQESMVSMSKSVQGGIQSTGAMRILSYPMHPQTSLIFTLSYRVKFEREKGIAQTRDFIVGWSFQVPSLADMNENLPD